METLSAQPPSGRDAIGGFIWSSIGYFGTLAIALLTGILITRTLGVEEFGRYSYLIWLSSTVAALASAGLPRAVARFAGAYRAAGATRRLERMARASVLAGVGGALLLSSALTAAQLLPPPTRPGTYAVVALATLVTAALSVSTAALQGSMEFRKLARVNLIGGLVLLTLSVAVALHGASAVWQLAASAAASLVTLAMHIGLLGLLPASAPVARPEPAESQAIWHGPFVRYWSAASILVLIELVVWQRAEIFFLNGFSTPEQIGYYNAAIALSARAVAIAFLLAPVLNAVVAGTSEAHAASLRSRFWHSSRWLSIAAMPILLIPAGAAEPLVTTLFGQAYRPAGLPLAILLVGGLVLVMSLPSAAVMYGTDRMGLVLLTGAAAAVTSLLADRLLIPRYAAVGAASASLSGQTVAVVSTFVLGLRPLGYRFPGKCFGLSLASGLAAGALVFAISRAWPTLSGLVLAALAGGLVYVALLRVLRVLEPRDLVLAEHLRPHAPTFLQPAIEGTFRWLTTRP